MTVGQVYNVINRNSVIVRVREENGFHDSRDVYKFYDYDVLYIDKKRRTYIIECEKGK